MLFYFSVVEVRWTKKICRIWEIFLIIRDENDKEDRKALLAEVEIFFLLMNEGNWTFWSDGRRTWNDKLPLLAFFSFRDQIDKFNFYSPGIFFTCNTISIHLLTYFSCSLEWTISTLTSLIYVNIYFMIKSKVMETKKTSKNKRNETKLKRRMFSRINIFVRQLIEEWRDQ